MNLLISIFVVSCLFLTASTQAFTEDERVAGHHTRNFTWPVVALQPNNRGWDRHMRRRRRQVSEIQNIDQRFTAYAHTLSAALIQPSFTEVSSFPGRRTVRL